MIYKFAKSLSREQELWRTYYEIADYGFEVFQSNHSVVQLYTLYRSLSGTALYHGLSKQELTEIIWNYCKNYVDNAI